MSDREKDHCCHPDVCNMNGMDNDQLETFQNEAKEDLECAIEAYQSIKIPEELGKRVLEAIRMATERFRP